MDDAPGSAAAPEGDQVDADTISTRTRTKFSLVNVPIDTLEASLPDAEAAPETEEDREYQRFLSSLLPNEQENLSFLDEEDEEYRPDEEDDDHEDEEARRGISKKELTDLLLDSTHMTFPKAPGIVAALEPRKEVREEMEGGASEASTSIATPLPMAEGSGEKMKIPAAKTGLSTARDAAQLDSKPAAFRGRRGAVTQAQCIQLASQMHKHLQLLLQSYHLLAKGTPTPALAECRAMIEELQQRGEKALRYKNALLSKLNPATTGAGSVINPADVEAADNDGDKSAPVSTSVDTSGSASTTENLLALRRVTRSLTAAHAAVAHPSMFELVGSQTVDELSAGFARGCSLEERNCAIQEQMLQLDTHLLLAKKRKRTKKGFSTSEDTLLADGVKRFGSQTESWEQIQKHFLPLKSTQNIRQRYKYLTGKKSGMNAIKAFYQQSPHVRGTGWLLEEDVRIARGLVELHDERYHFARLAKSFLPHRSRLEIRKRWERITAKFRAELAEVGLVAPKDNSLDLAVAMKEYLEDKLRDRMMRQRGEAETAKFDAALQLQQLGHGSWDAPEAGGFTSDAGSAEKMVVNADSCKTKNLHPALFFSSWSFISPATLLNSTCNHNWPSFMDEGKEGKSKSQLEATTTAADSADIAAPAETFLGSEGIQLISARKQVEPLDDDQGISPLDLSVPSEISAVQATETLDVATSTQLQFGQLPQVSTPFDFAMLQEEGEEEEDDSDYEHDELLSSENDESDSDFEQMELSDDDDDDDAGDDEGSGVTFETLLSDSDDQSVKSVELLRTPSPHSSPSRPSLATPIAATQVARASKLSQRMHHPLRLQNLGQPGNERMKRALAALERRIVGKSIAGPTSSAASIVTQSSRALNKRPKRKMAATLVAPLGVSRSSSNMLLQSNQTNSNASNDESGHFSSGTAAGNDGESEDDEWGDGSGDEGFEVDELPSSSDEFSSGTADEDHEDNVPSNPTAPAAAVASRRPVPSAAADNSALPNKKPKLQRCPTCGHVTCTCSSSARMQLLLRRMKEKRSSSTL